MAGLRVLFVGNSCTYFNDLPEILRSLIPGLRYGQVTKGGQNLSGHANDAAVRWMITGEGVRPPHGVPRYSHDEFFADGEGWDILVLQDRADIIKDWSQFEANSTIMNESLEALDTLASWVRIVASKMRRRPSVLLFHRCLWSYTELAHTSNTAAMCRRGREGIELYLRRLSGCLGPNVPVQIMPACEAFCHVHKESPDVFRHLYAGDKEHPSRMGTYLAALLLYKFVTGSSPLSAPRFRPTDDSARIHADMWNGPDEWPSADLWQMYSWPRWKLPEIDDELDKNLRMWAHSVLPDQVCVPASFSTPGPYSYDLSKQTHMAPGDGPPMSLLEAKTFGSASLEKHLQTMSHLPTKGKRVPSRFDGRSVCQEIYQAHMIFTNITNTIHVRPSFNPVEGVKLRSMTW